MNRLTVSLVLAVVSVSSVDLTGCASDAKRRSEQDMIVVDKKSDRQVVAEFDGACAMSLVNGKYHFGDDRYVLQHDGKTYYFASAEAKKKFEQNLDDNIQKADQNWARAMALGEMRHTGT